MDNQSSLCRMYLELIDERETIRSKIQNNNDEINHITQYLDMILTEENKELSMFSPRNVLHLMNDKIREQQNRMETLEEENRTHYRESNKLDDRIEALQVILKKEGYSIDPNVLRETLDDFHSNSISGFNLLSQQGRNTYESSTVDTEGAYDEKNTGFSDRTDLLLSVMEQKGTDILDTISNSPIKSLQHCLHSIDMCHHYWNVDPMRAKLELETIARTIQSAIHSLNDMIVDLQSVDFDRVGLYDSLISYVKEVQTCYNIRIDISIDQSVDYDRCAEMIHVKHFAKRVLYEAIKECIRNSIVISQCDCISITMRPIHDSVELTIEENGKVCWDDDRCNKVVKIFTLVDAVMEYKYEGGMIIHVMIPCRG